MKPSSNQVRKGLCSHSRARRLQTVRMLIEMGGAAVHFVPDIVRRLDHESDKAVRINLISSLGLIRKDSPIITTKLGEVLLDSRANPHERRMAATALRLIGGQGSRQIFRKALRSRAAKSRALAVHEIACMHADAVHFVDELLRFLDDTDPDVRGSAVRALVAIGEPVIPVVVARLDHESDLAVVSCAAVILETRMWHPSSEQRFPYSLGPRIGPTSRRQLDKLSRTALAALTRRLWHSRVEVVEYAAVVLGRLQEYLGVIRNDIIRFVCLRGAYPGASELLSTLTYHGGEQPWVTKLLLWAVKKSPVLRVAVAAAKALTDRHVGGNWREAIEQRVLRESRSRSAMLQDELMSLSVSMGSRRMQAFISRKTT